MFEQKQTWRTLLCCAAFLVGCQTSSDGADPSDEQVGEAVSLPELTPIGEDVELEGAAQSLVADLLCKTCTTSADCGGAPNYCLKRGDGTRFCGSDCRESSCPTGYSCTRLGYSIHQCVPRRSDCSRLSDAGAPADAGSISDAAVPDEAGSARDAATPADAGAAQDAATPAEAGSALDAASLADASAPDAAGGSARDAAVLADAGLSTSDAGATPNSAQCAATANWDPAWVAFEDEVLRLSNLQRQAGAVCGTTSYPPVPPLSADPALRCAARLHAKDLQERDYFSHSTPDGVTFDQRITQAGYRWRTLGENIAAGYRTPQAVVLGWIQSPGHCQNIMNATFTQLGVGFYDDYRWTQDFGKPF
jgi:uncharacterized protein YkwD